ncbi:MAG: thymidylate kinase [Rhodomicrobium sp.]|nr:MAG: thymidylate kinase [Rhodomicrobium sp.]
MKSDVKPTRARGRFISFEGGEGAGKSTQARLLAEHLGTLGYPTLLTREPGGSAFAEKIRRFLLEGRVKKYGPVAEALLFYTARLDHLNNLILPNMEKGVWVISDRFLDSSRAYQGAASGVEEGIFDALDRLVVGDNQPELTIIVDLPVEVASARVAERQKNENGEVDRFESEDRQFHERLRAGFLEIAANNANRCVIVDGNQSREKVAALIWQLVVERFGLQALT